MSKATRKLDEEQQATLIDWLAHGHSTGFIIDRLSDLWEIDFTKQTVSYYRNTYKEEIRARKALIMQAIPIADRAHRQLVRMMLIEDIMQRGLWVTRYDAQGNAYQTGNHGTINQILDSAAKDQGDLVDDNDSTVLKFKMFLQLSGKSMQDWLYKGQLPELSEIRRLQAAQDQRSKEGE